MDLIRHLCVLAVVASPFLLAACSGGDSDEPEINVSSVNLGSLEEGDCLTQDSVEQSNARRMTVVQCDDARAYGLITKIGDIADDNAEFPSAADMEAAIENLCDEPTGQFRYFAPTFDSWQRGDREAICIVPADEASRE